MKGIVIVGLFVTACCFTFQKDLAQNAPELPVLSTGDKEVTCYQCYGEGKTLKEAQCQEGECTGVSCYMRYENMTDEEEGGRFSVEEGCTSSKAWVGCVPIHTSWWRTSCACSTDRCNGNITVPL